ACQSYYEGIMAAGANFGSSPGRILIHALDPAIVGRKVAVTDFKKLVTPSEIAALTKSGSKGVGGIDTHGHSRQ
ncbi:MAG: sporulation peptidase YabG, partial [Clostridiales bacterium]|nr:sporulation peptidase YabG [Clostridiales bacterium]